GMDHESAFGSEGRGRPNPDEARQDRAQAARQRCKSVTTRTQPRREQLRNVRRPQRPGAEGLEKLEGGEQKDSDDEGGWIEWGDDQQNCRHAGEGNQQTGLATDAFDQKYVGVSANRCP